MNTFKYLLAGGGLLAALGGYSLETSAQVRLWGTYYGGSENDFGNKIATDNAGNVYVVGVTSSSNGIVTPDGFDSIKSNSVVRSGYLAKFDTNGTLVWATYYGDGAKAAQLKDVGIDGNGNVYVLGDVECTVTGLASQGAFQGQCKGSRDLYLAKFNPQGQRIWGTYLGGSGNERAGGLSVLANGNVYLIADTTSAQGIASAISADKTLGGLSDAMVAKFTANGGLSWSRYFGGQAGETGVDISCRAFTAFLVENCFITGMTESAVGIAVGNSHDNMLNGIDGFVARLSGVTGGTSWSTYYGGSGEDGGSSIVVDKDLNAYVAGFTHSSDLGTTPGAFSGRLDGLDGFVAKFNVSGLRVAATYFGNKEDDFVSSLALDANNRLYLLGSIEADASPQDDPATPGAFDTTLNGRDAVVAKFNEALGLSFATYYGGSGDEMTSFPVGGGITIGKDNHIYITGDTDSQDAISTPNAHKVRRQGGRDGFLAELIP